MRTFAVVAIATMLGAGAKESGAQQVQALVDAFGRQSAPDQYKQLGDALVASPALTGQLSAAALAGRLTGFEMASPQRRQTAPFATTVERGKIIFAADFFGQVVKKRLYDVVQKDDILPNNLVFVLGGLAFHLQSRPVPMGSDMASFVKASVEKDARSFIQGWNDVVDAAVRENGNKTLTPQQQASLLLNLSYRGVFIDRANTNKIKWSSTGTLEPTDQNVAAIVESIGRMKLLDFGVAPGT